ncbi:hypothetical protein VF_1797 [Aliivibrio fischeri ES114]|uniref:Outer membrane protein beta-barrel domain-containing protein n=2 Tax=Aliivibrio fischeri TaxID=668 RepID=Q5E3V4_ALIF1|nr:hypothetical protein VF_1797 [Aliivibrio fischeri ES114]
MNLMKYLLSCALLLISCNCFAKFDGLYLSSGLAKSSLTLNGAEIDLDNGLFIKAGYPFMLAPEYYLIVELEYNKLGDYEHHYSNGANYDNTEVEASSIGANLKYQSYLFDTEFYLASILGVHQYSLDLMVDTYSQNTLNGKTITTTITGENSIREVGLSYGVELGYSLPYSLNIAASYTMGRIIANGIGIDFITSQVTLSYVF